MRVFPAQFWSRSGLHLVLLFLIRRVRIWVLKVCEQGLLVKFS